MQIDRMNVGEWGKIKAFFDIKTSEGFVLKGFKLIEGINGLFVGFPSQKDNEGEYRDTIWAEKEVREHITKLAINELRAPSSQTQYNGGRDEQQNRQY